MIAKIKELVKRVLIERENRDYRKRLGRLQVTYVSWAAAMEAERAKSLNIPDINSAGDDFVVICASSGTLSQDAIPSIVSYFNLHRETQLLYGDEDVWAGCDLSQNILGERSHPWFKPDWSPDLLDSYPYFGSVAALRKELFDKVQNECMVLLQDADKAVNGGVLCYTVTDLEGYEKLLHRCAALAGGYIRKSKAIGHIPAILFHCDNEREQAKFSEKTSHLQISLEEYTRDFRDGWVLRKSKEAEAAEREPIVSIVIPSKDQPEILEKCLRGCMLAGCMGEEHSLPLEIILVDNGSSQENRSRVERLAESFSFPEFRIRYLYRPMEFHFSAMCNMGAEQAAGNFLLFLNDDVELCQPGCIEKMAALADRDYTGAVGMKLLYPDSTRIQHAGITNLPMGPVHKLQFLDDNICYYYGANRGWKNVLAVTAACLMVEKNKFQEAGGFSEELRVAFNDVGLGFRLHELGCWNVCMNDLYAYHHESLSRGADEAPEKLERLLAERDRLYSMHPRLLNVDPYYSEFLNREGLDTRIRPAFVTAGNRLQKVKNTALPLIVRGCRQDECLLVRVEECQGERIRGYSVVLGDNNACYDKGILFRRVSPVIRDEQIQSETPDEIYVVGTSDQYRPDLTENMPDQINVGLSGFAVELKCGIVPVGSYQLGAIARNRITGLRLVNWSNRVYRVEA